jgi:hypothetical protein
MEQETAPATAKTRSRIWLPFVACPLGVILGRYVGKWTYAALGFPIPQVRAELTSLYDGRMPGGIYGGVGAFFAGLIMVIFVRHRCNAWLALAASLAGGAVSAAFGAVMET